MKYQHAVVVGLAVAGLIGFLAPIQSEEKETPRLDRAEAKKAFAYLNRVRSDPAAFSAEIGADLSGVKKAPELKWNDTLAKVAEEKALDMATRNYFAHVTPDGLGINIMMDKAGYKLPAYRLRTKDANHFESIAAGPTTGKEVIKMLILDKDVESLGHRLHLLGIGAQRSKNLDAGIGFVRSSRSKYQTYISIIIAHRG